MTRAERWCVSRPPPRETADCHLLRPQVGLERSWYDPQAAVPRRQQQRQRRRSAEVGAGALQPSESRRAAADGIGTDARLASDGETLLQLQARQQEQAALLERLRLRLERVVQTETAAAAD